ncbi:MAG: LysR family transcriptional regulator [Phycisphaerales bacterium JB059]
MELTPLRQFIAICEHGHITRAAEALGVTQPALSAMLKKLESEVDAELLHRTGRGVEPTDAGRAFLDHARAAVRQADTAVAAVRELVGLEHGSIRVGGGATAVGYVLPRVISRVHRELPGLRFLMKEAGSSAVAQGVLGGEHDLGIVTEPVTIPGSADLLRVATISDELRLIVPPAHPLEGRKSFRWKDLDAQPVVAFEAGSAVRGIIDAAASAHAVALDVVMELRSIESIVQMVRAEIGVGFVSRFALEADPTLGAGLRCADAKLTRELAVVRRRDRIPSHAAAAFERALLAELRRRPAR